MIYDDSTLNYYKKNYYLLYEKYTSEIHKTYYESLQKVFSNSPQRILEIGAGSGRDMKILMNLGHDVYGIDSCEPMVELVKHKNPDLQERIKHSYFPVNPILDGEEYDGILCTAVIMHIPREYLLDSIFNFKKLLKKKGKILLSINTKRAGLADNRDKEGRLFILYTREYIQILFERAGFRLEDNWESEDGLGRSEIMWEFLVFSKEDSESLKPLDKIEGVINRDRKTTTYKFALIRSLCDISIESFHSIKWEKNFAKIPLKLIAEKWIDYYWSIFSSEKFIAQHNGESFQKIEIAFRKQLYEKIVHYNKLGGIHTFWEFYFSRKDLEIREIINKIMITIKKGPIEYAGGSIGEKIFQYDSKSKDILIPFELMREISLMNYLIRDSIFLRWIDLSYKMNYGNISKSELFEILNKEHFDERNTFILRPLFDSIKDKSCVWSGNKIISTYEIDHIIPYSLWKNNSLWNLVPASPEVNNRKSDKLPSLRLLEKRKDSIIYFWENIYNYKKDQFVTQAKNFIGANFNINNWKSQLFSTLVESIEITAVHRGIERYE